MKDNGVVFICNLIDEAEPGNMPNQVLDKVSKYWYESRYISASRQYYAKGVNEQVDRLLRIHRDEKIKIGQYAVLGNDEQYRIINVSHGNEQFDYTRMVDQKYYKTARIVGLDYTEISLQRVEKYYDVRT